MKKQPLPKEFYQWMENLQAVDFVLVELNLYLDTHPQDQSAVNQYNEYVHQRKKIADKIETVYGPLKGFGQSYAGYPWNWDDPPWPWQL
ncbi:MAG TPA: spore coat protein CotJB [Bacillales bacterium]|nr:spore coat protein CotJB [Bacillales bacterium]